MTQIEAMKQMVAEIDALPEGLEGYFTESFSDALFKLRQAIAEAEREPRTDLIARLRDTASKGVSVWGDLMLEAAKEIEILTAERECYASSMDRILAAQPKQCTYPDCSYPCMDLPDCIEQEPVAWGFQNTAITGSNRWMMLREEVPSNDQYGGALWIPLYTHPPQRTKQKPVAYLNPDDLCADTAFRWCKIDAFTKPVYLHSPQRTWVGLTDEDIDEWTPEIHVVIKAIESKLKQKNGY